MEGNNSDVKIGKIIEKDSFKRRSNKNKNILIDNIKIDYIDKKNKILYETKKSSKHIKSAIWQMKYYLYTLNSDYIGIIEIPKEKLKKKVVLENCDIENFKNIKKEIKELKNSKAPPVLNSKKCKKCAFYTFCYS